MKWVSTVSDEPGLAEAVREVAVHTRSRLGGESPDLVVVFVSEHHRDDYESLPDLLAAEMPTGLLVGCSAGGVIGGGREVEKRPGLSITAAVLPEVELAGFHMVNESLPERDAAASVWEERVHVRAERDPNFLLLPDPFTFDAEIFIAGLDRAFPCSRKVGGLVSGGREPGASALYLGSRAYRAGVVGVSMSGNIRVETIVAQGCRPIGEPMFVTSCRENVLGGLDGQPPLHVLQEIYQQLDARDQELFRHSLFLGIAMSGQRQEYRQGDFLIRNIVGIDRASGALGIGAVLKENQVVQFHLRDARASADDLEALLERHGGGEGRLPAEGSLLFSCLGRGVHLYGRPDHDTDAFRRHLGDLPLGGFFCNGEIGPVHGTTFLHGYTSAFGLFGPASPLRPARPRESSTPRG